MPSAGLRTGLPGDSPDNPATGSGEPASSRIEREHFRLLVPGEWVAEPQSGSLEYEFWKRDRTEQLLVSVLVAREALDAARRESVVRRLGEARVGAIREMSGGHAEHSALSFGEGNGQCEVRCAGVDGPNGVRFAFVLRAAEDRTVTVSLFRYALQEDGLRFDAYAGAVFDLLQFPRHAAAVEY